MTRFLLEPPEFEIPTLSYLRSWWQNVPYYSVREQVVVEAQYLAFHRFLLQSLHFELPNWDPPVHPALDLSVRAGAVKTANLLAASIIEAVLRAHAEKRGYALPPNPRHRTFGKILDAWEGSGAKDFLGVSPQLCRIHDLRNTAHLYHAAESQQSFSTLLHEEQELLNAADTVLAVIQTIQSA